MKRLTEELIAHYRALMLAALPGGQALLSGVSPEEEALYLEKGPQLGQREAIRAIRALGSALEHMTRGSDQRIELELALFSLSEPPLQPVYQAAPVQTAAAPAPRPAAPQPFAAAPVQPFARAPAAETAQPVVQPAAKAEPSQVQTQAAPAAAPVKEPSAQAEPASAPADDVPPLPEEPPLQAEAAPPWDEPAAQSPPSAESAEPPAQLPQEPEPAARPEPVPVPENPADPVLNKPRKVAQEGVNPFPYWEKVVQQLQEKDPMLYTYLKKSKGYFDGTRVLIDGGKTFRDFIRANKDSQRLIKKLIAQVSGVAVPIGPYEPKAVHRSATNAEESLRRLEQLGVDVSIEESAKKKR